MLMDNVGPTGSMNNDGLLRALLHARNTPDPDCNISPAQVVFGRHLRDVCYFISRCIKYNNPSIRPTWRKAWSQKEDVMRARMPRSFYVVETPGPVILGLPTSRDLLLVTLNCAVKGVTINSTDDLHRAYPDRFQGIGKFEGHFHNSNLHQLMRAAQKHGLVFNSDKCKINTSKLHFFGLVFDANGVHPDPARIDDIRSMTKPANADELREFLGIAAYMSPFIPKLSANTATLRDLIKKDTAALVTGLGITHTNGNFE